MRYVTRLQPPRKYLCRYFHGLWDEVRQQAMLTWARAAHNIQYRKNKLPKAFLSQWHMIGKLETVSFLFIDFQRLWCQIWAKDAQILDRGRRQTRVKTPLVQIQRFELLLQVVRCSRLQGDYRCLVPPTRLSLARANQGKGMFSIDIWYSEYWCCLYE